FLIACYAMFAFVVYQAFPKHFLKIAAAGALIFLITDQVSAHLIKPFFQRLRPCNDHHVVFRLIIEHCGSGFSFVSAHATNSFGMATFLSVFLFRQRATVVTLIVWATLVSFSQVYVGIHYPGDVMAGGVLGIIIGSIIGLISKKIISPTQTNP
ncbi:MAG: phosphatase PAP2 family protein, partial [Bacteroidota bacterium]